MRLNVPSEKLMRLSNTLPQRSVEKWCLNMFPYFPYNNLFPSASSTSDDLGSTTVCGGEFQRFITFCVKTFVRNFLLNAWLEMLPWENSHRQPYQILYLMAQGETLYEHKAGNCRFSSLMFLNKSTIAALFLMMISEKAFGSWWVRIMKNLNNHCLMHTVFNAFDSLRL